MRDNFPAPLVRKLAERAGYICSNPGCNRVTVGPSDADPAKSSKIGVAAHICAAAANGPRYDMSQTPAQRGGIENGIWLCAACAALVDKNQGIDYPTDHLRRWKADHETLMKSCLEGAKRIVFQFLQAPTDVAAARKVLVFLEQRGALFMPHNAETPNHVFESVKDVRRFLTEIQAGLSSDSPLDVIVDSMNHACRHFMNTTSADANMAELSFGLGALRKVIGINIGQIEKVYSLNVKGPLRDTIPH